jgi:hypothetical protein
VFGDVYLNVWGVLPCAAKGSQVGIRSRGFVWLVEWGVWNFVNSNSNLQALSSNHLSGSVSLLDDLGDQDSD